MLLARYLSGEATDAEAALVRAWMAADAANRAEMEEMRRAWSASFPLEYQIDTDVAWQRVASRLHEAMHGTPHDDTRIDTHALADRAAHAEPAAYGLSCDGRGAVSRPRSAAVFRRTAQHSARRGTTRRLTALAAAAAVAVAGGLALRGRGWRSVETQDARTTRTFISQPGQRALIDLADGTHIVLAPASRLTASLPDGSAGIRDVVLDGEAMFTVTHDVHRPFLVHSRYGTTTDVGTAFAVRAYASEPYRIVVRDGAVSIGDHGRIVLVGGDVATRGLDGTMRVAHGADVAQLLGWVDGRLSFDHTRFVDLVPELERRYGVDITIASPALRDHVLTGDLSTESLSEAMDALGAALGARHITHGTHVSFMSRWPQ